MEILSWNIMSGGFNSCNSTAMTPDRIDLLASTIKSIDADFVSLVDTHRWTEIFTFEDLKKLFGYQNVYSVKLEDERLKLKGHDNGVTVLTRLPVGKFETIRMFSRNAIKTSAGGVDIFTTYLDDVSEDTRMRQTDTLLDHVSTSVPTIITGDLNTIDEFDLTETRKQVEEMFDKRPEARVAQPVFKEMMRCEVTRKIRQSGFIDMGKGKGNTVPSKLVPIKIDQPITRLDYGFCTSNINIENFEVLRGAEFDQLSDHYPIKMSVELG